MPYPPISALPATPSRNAPATFSALMDAFLAAFPTLRSEINALAAYLDVLALATGPGLFQNGSAGAPGISFASGTNSGFYRISADIIGVAIGGVEVARITSAGMQLTGILSGTAVIQTDDDTTTGRLMKVGAAGWSKAQGNYPMEYDFDTWGVSPSGAYWYNNTGDAGPTGLGYGTVLALNYAASRQHRIALDADAARMHIGYLDSAGVQGPWSEIFGQRSILGTVSQSGGVPTGRLIETSSNANGCYIKFADGTLICYAELSVTDCATAIGSSYESAAVTWTFPAAFVASTPPAVVFGDAGTAREALNAAPASATTVSLRATCAISVTGAIPLRPVAIGRWF